MMKKVCKLTGKEFIITEQEIEVLKKMGLKFPLYSPKVRSAMRLAFRNERNLFMRNCDFSGERIISIYHDKHPFPVYKYEHWLSDKWTPPHIGYDPDKDFFEQYNELSKLVPRVNLFAPYNENCDYVNAAEKNKNCYMHILADRSEDCYYTHGVYSCRDCIDCDFLINGELCYEATDCRDVYHLRCCYLCDNSSNLSFCFDMRGCNNCFLCYGLRNQQYCINNKQYTKEEYEKMVGQVNMFSYYVYSYSKKKFIDKIVKNQSYTRMINTENSNGNFLINCKNCHNCFDVEDGEDCINFRIGSNHVKDIADTHAVVDGSELLYNCVSGTESYNCHNIIGCWTTKNSFYSQFLQGCSDCIGCISLRQKKNCILNKEYSKEEYERFKKHIIESLGDYYGSAPPFYLAPFTYQDSAYRDYEEMTREEVEKIGWVYGEEEKTEGGDYRSISEIPDVNNGGDEIERVYKCEVSNKPFKIIKHEINLLKRIGAPLPRKHHDVRFAERTQYRKKAI